MPARSTRSRTAAHTRVAPRRSGKRPLRRRRGLWGRRLAVWAVVLVCGAVGWAVVARWAAPEGNTAQGRFDAVVVLGSKADSDGNPGPTLLARTTEGVREYQRGVAPRLILSGGADSGTRVMARVAEAQGVPASAIVSEPESLDTVQSACFVTRLMKAHGWRSAEVVTSRGEAPRAAMIFSGEPIAWRMRVASPLELGSRLGTLAGGSVELLETMRYLLYSEWAERCSP